eukprot:4596933-Alexandrium_andersonii.AAC.1
MLSSPSAPAKEGLRNEVEQPEPRGLAREPPRLAVEEHSEPRQRPHTQAVRAQSDRAAAALLREGARGRHR